MQDTKIFVAGHRGLVGSAIVRQLHARGLHNVVTRTRQELDLCDQPAVMDFFARERPEQVYMAAAKVGGILANETYPADFISENLLVQSNVIQAAHRYGVERLLFLGSSCIYPRLADQPMPESALLSGPLEPTNEPYAVAKIAGIKMCESFNRQFGTDFRSVMPTNLYGPGDNFDAHNSHVIPGLMRRFLEAKRSGSPVMVIWGTGRPMREFMYVDDMAAACTHVMALPKDVYHQHTAPRLSHINVGTGVDVTIRELAETLAEVVGYEGRIEFDASKPDGMPRKLLDVSLLEGLGWKAQTDLRTGLTLTYEWVLANGGAMRL